MHDYKSNLKIGIIGCGVIAPTHIESYLNIPGVKVVALCDLVEDKCRKLAAKYNLDAKIATDFRDILDGLDAVSVCTDHYTHAQICTVAIERGINVLCEKPLASDNSGVDEILASLKKNPSIIFSAVFQNRYNPVFKALKHLIDNGAFGKIVSSGVSCSYLRTNEYYNADFWRGKWRTEGGSLMINQAIHYLDLLLWLCGNPRSVSAKFANLTHQGVIETEDTASVAIEFESGTLGTVSATNSSFSEWQNMLWLSGTDGFVLFNNGNPIEIMFRNPEMREFFNKLCKTWKSDIDIKIGKSYYGNTHILQISDFVDALRNKTTPFISAQSAARTVKTVMAIYESQRSGKSVQMIISAESAL